MPAMVALTWPNTASKFATWICMSECMQLWCIFQIARVRHYSDVIMSVMGSQITDVSIVCLTVCSGADQRKHQSSASLAFVGESTDDPWILLTKGQLRSKVPIWWRHHVKCSLKKKYLNTKGEKMAAILQTLFSNAFPWKQSMVMLIKISLKFIPEGQISMNAALVQI